MSTRKHFIATFVHEFNTGLLSANIFEGWLHRGRSSFHFSEAISALARLFMLLELFASFSDMVGFCLAMTAEVLLTTMAANTKSAHMLGCFF